MNQALQRTGRLLSTGPAGNTDVLLRIECPEIASRARPGQFVEVRTTAGFEPFFRRPVSIYDCEGDEVRLLVRVVGQGTRQMAAWQPGMEIDMIGPLGRGFSVEGEGKDVLLVAGGIGLAPLYFWAKRLRADGHRAHLVFSPRRERELLEAAGTGPMATVLFSENRHTLGNVVRQALGARPVSAIYTCGPEGLMKAVVAIGEKHGVPVQVSLETRMACGIGICLGCAAPIREKDQVVYRKVCSDGPVFRGEEVLFDA